MTTERIKKPPVRKAKRKQRPTHRKRLFELHEDFWRKLEYTARVYGCSHTEALRIAIFQLNPRRPPKELRRWEDPEADRAIRREKRPDLPALAKYEPKPDGVDPKFRIEEWI